jgi:hypothetical protein
MRTTHGITGLGTIASISSLTHEVSHLRGVTGVTIGVDPAGVSILTLTSTSRLDEENLAQTLRSIGCGLTPLHAA